MDISNDNSKCYYSRTEILFKKGTVIKKVHLDLGNPRLPQNYQNWFGSSESKP